MNEEVIKIEYLVDILIKRWKFILLITLTTTILSIIISFFIIPPKYEASTKMFIGKEDSKIQGKEQNYNDSDVQMYQKLLKTYSEVIQTNDLVEKAVDIESLGLKAKDIFKNLEVIPRADTQIIEIKYTNKEKMLARDILDSITTEFIKTSSQLIPNSNIKIIESVKIPNNPVNSNKFINIAVAFLLGLMISIGISFLLAVIDNTLKNKEQMEKVLQLPVLGIIPDFLNNERE